jgi:uncharacterized membrane protein
MNFLDQTVLEFCLIVVGACLVWCFLVARRSRLQRQDEALTRELQKLEEDWKMTGL